MRVYDPETLARLQARTEVITRRLVWIEARNLATGQVEGLGLWSGEYDLSIDLEGAPRLYLGTGALLESEPITAGPGLDVRVHQLALAAIDPQVERLVKAYDTRFAPVQMHRALLEPGTMQIIGTPHRVFKGLVNSVDFPHVPGNQQPSCVVEVVSETRQLTRGLALKKSDKSQQERGGDRFRRYGDISGSVPVYWGEKMHGGYSRPVKAKKGVSSPFGPNEER